MGKRKERPEDFSIQSLVGQKIKAVTESESGLYWIIDFFGRPGIQITVTARCLYDEHGGYFREDV